MSKKILIVEDEVLVALAMEKTLRKDGYEISAIIDNSDDLIPAIVNHKPDLILMDIRINSFGDGVNAIERANFVTQIPIIYITAHNDPMTRERAEKTNPFAYLLKPVEEKKLLSTVHSVFE